MTTPFWTIFCAPHKQAIETYPNKSLPYYYCCPLCKTRTPLLKINVARAVEFFHRKKHFVVVTKCLDVFDDLKRLGYRLEPLCLA